MITTDYQEIFNLDKAILDSIDPEINKLLLFWKSDNENLTVLTSGSTGNPKKINISKKQMIVSSENTLQYFNINENSTFLNCLPVKYIGGKIMLIRAILSKGKIILCKPSVNPINELDIEIEIDFVALTPLQLNYLLEKKHIFKKIKLAIIGGGLVSENLISKIQNLTTNCFQTYGMTETISHIAVRNLKNCTNKTPYKCLEDIKVRANKKNQLIINSKKLNIKNLVTNDKVKILSNEEFLFLNRTDTIINSGGLKINPEEVENKILKSLGDNNFFVDKIKNDKFGEEIILIALKKIELNLLIESIKLLKDKKIQPKKIYIVDKFIFNDNQKIDKLKSKNYAYKLKKIHTL
ncbi:AMP-binding protein [Flavobacteriales bacterium]|nr:AMP-binding protein [Flavobacteriales bacterium]